MNPRPERYRDIFRLRGESLDAAMQDWPHALDAEVLPLVDALKLEPGQRVLELGAAGGYLAAPVAARGAHYHGVDGSEVLVGCAQRRGLDVRFAAPDALPCPAQHFDALIAQAALHHESDWLTLFVEARRVARPGARFVVGEVAAGSPFAAFLDDFVDRHCPFGHRGRYADDGFVETLRRAGWTVESDTERHHVWRCASEADLHRFLTRLFFMPELDPATLFEGLRTYLGGVVHDADGVAMPWGLRVVYAHNPG